MGSHAVVAENATDKAMRLLQEGRLMIERVDPDVRYVRAKCRGDSGEVYALGHDPAKNEWRCTCEARGVCSHLIALQRVVVISSE